MISLKKPYTPTMFIGTSATFNVYGKSFARLQAIYLSGAPMRNTTFHNPFSAIPKLSANNPGFFGVKLPPTAYSTNFDNTITINVPRPRQTGYVDIIVQNPAGYGKLTQYTIKELYSGIQDLSALNPWLYGIKVLSGNFVGVENQMITIDGDFLITISGDSIVYI